MIHFTRVSPKTSLGTGRLCNSLANVIWGKFQIRFLVFILIGFVLLGTIQSVVGANTLSDPLDQQFASFFGGNDTDLAHNMAVDSEGNIILSGVTTSTNYPTINAFQSSPGGAGDGFITKISSDGQEVIFSTYLGGSSLEILGSVGIDSDDNIVVIGSTESADFPTHNPYKDSMNGTIDLFFTKFDPDGNVLFSTFFGGDGWEHGRCPRFDSLDNIIIIGHTTSIDFPVSGDAYQKIHAGEDDAFIVKISANGQTLLHSTLLGGNGTDGGNYAFLDDNNKYVLCGFTSSPDFPTTVNAYQSTYGGNGDGFIVILDFDDNSLVYSTLIGGIERDYLWKITQGNATTALIAGYTESDNFPTTPNAFQTTLKGTTDGILLKFDTSNLVLNYSTLFGGSTADDFRKAIVDSNGNIVIIGTTNSNDYPITSNAFQIDKKGDLDILITILDSTGRNLLYSTFYGGDGADYGNSISLYNGNELIIAGATGSVNIPVLNPYQSSKSGGYDSFFSKFTINHDSLTITIQGPIPLPYFCLILVVSFIVLNNLRRRKKHTILGRTNR